jgi:hypothetical protein
VVSELAVITEVAAQPLSPASPLATTQPVELPRTGADPTGLLYAAAACVLVGVAARRCARRSQRRRPHDTLSAVSLMGACGPDS